MLACVRTYRENMAKFSQMRALDVWYASMDAEKYISGLKNVETRKRITKRLAKARARNVVEQDFPKLADVADDTATIRDNPPLIYHWDGLRDMNTIQQAFARYRETLVPERRVLLDRFPIHDMALKVVGVGSVGTLCAVILLMANEDDPLFPQVKEATASVLEAYAGKSAYPNHGERVVRGTLLMQAASDHFLGWTEGKGGRHFYIRQLRDMKTKILVEVFDVLDMMEYAEICGFTLARAHARSAEPVLISGYLGRSDTFDKAIASFSVAYADQSESDHGVLMEAVRRGDLEVEVEPDR